MDAVLILARTSDGKLWQATHFGGTPGWTWRSAPEGENEIMGHLVLAIPAGGPMPTSPGMVLPDMLPGVLGEGSSHP
jgi:hypothetical protein